MIYKIQLLMQQIVTVLPAALLESSFRTPDNSSGVSDHQPLVGSHQRRLAVHPVNVVARRGAVDVEPVERRRGGDRGEILNIPFKLRERKYKYSRLGRQSRWQQQQWCSQFQFPAGPSAPYQ